MVGNKIGMTLKYIARKHAMSNNKTIRKDQ